MTFWTLWKKMKRQLINVPYSYGFERGDPTTLAKDLTDDNVNVVVDEAASLLRGV